MGGDGGGGRLGFMVYDLGFSFFFLGGGGVFRIQGVGAWEGRPIGLPVQGVCLRY